MGLAATFPREYIILQKGFIMVNWLIYGIYAYFSLFSFLKIQDQETNLFVTSSYFAFQIVLGFFLRPMSSLPVFDRVITHSGTSFPVCNHVDSYSFVDKVSCLQNNTFIQSQEQQLHRKSDVNMTKISGTYASIILNCLRFVSSISVV